MRGEKTAVKEGTEKFREVANSRISISPRVWDSNLIGPWLWLRGLFCAHLL